MSPDEMRSSRWPDLMGAKVIASEENTYNSGGASSQLDYYLVANSIAEADTACYNVKEVSASKHDLVVLVMNGDIKARRVMRIKRPPRLLANRPEGLVNKPPPWNGFTEEAMEVRNQSGLDSLYATFPKKGHPRTSWSLAVRRGNQG